MGDDIVAAAAKLKRFYGDGLTRTLSSIERRSAGVTVDDAARLLESSGADADTFAAATAVKALAGEINVAIHALGSLRCLPHILQEGEVIEYVSLGAGNTGRRFDLETNLRVAEFKFIAWRGGPESIRQNGVFKDFFALAHHETPKSKHLYLLGAAHALRFLRGRRALASVLSRRVDLKAQFESRFGGRYAVVADYYADWEGSVLIEDVTPWLR
jgi:hypothetical protein